MYPDTVKTRAPQLWFKRFKDGDCTTDNPRSRRRPTLHDDILNETIALNSRQTTRNLAYKFNKSCSIIRGHLKKIRKTCIGEDWGLDMSLSLRAKHKVPV